MTARQPSLTLDDAGLEAAIDIAKLRCQTATTPARRRAAFEDMRQLIAQRSAGQVERLEKARGLR